jgi:hypothetical protein
VQPYYLWVDPTWYGQWERAMDRRWKAIFWTAVLVMLGLGALAAASAFIGPLVETFRDDDGPLPWYERALEHVHAI